MSRVDGYVVAETVVGVASHTTVLGAATATSELGAAVSEARLQAGSSTVAGAAVSILGNSTANGLRDVVRLPSLGFALVRLVRGFLRSWLVCGLWLGRWLWRSMLDRLISWRHRLVSWCSTAMTSRRLSAFWLSNFSNFSTD